MKLKIKSESTPQRCDICHQADCLDPINNVCLRCQDIKTSIEQLRLNLELEERENNLFFSFGRTRTTQIVAGLLSIVFVSNIVGLIGTIFLTGLICSLLAIQRILDDRALTGQPILDFCINVGLLGSGLACSYLSGCYLLR
ncbi:MAG: hypothetical protein IPK14_16940 [Blastocatellia bacterium]|nr:hypothetical protein [Blastocatellia bacterium]MBL8194444.1 hypothetical protein [Blastocatellia bacterium]MBN8725813.1 hypothetical protein [Acidobacteriota bacterium]